MIKSIKKYFEELQINVEEFTHEPFHTVEETLGVYESFGIPENKSLFLRDQKKRRYFLLVMDGHKRADLKQIGKLVNEKKLSFASPADLLSMLNTFPGAVSPFGLMFDTENHIEVFLDTDLTISPFIGFHPNDNTQTWKMTQGDFQKFLSNLGHEITEIDI